MNGLEVAPEEAVISWNGAFGSQGELKGVFRYKWIQQLQATELGKHGIIRGIEESNDFIFLLQVDAVKDATYSRLL